MQHVRDVNRILLVAFLSVMVNVLLFTGLPNLLPKVRIQADLESIQAVDFLRDPPGRQTERPSERPDDPPPEPPRVIPQRSIDTMQVKSPLQPSMDMPAFDLAVNAPDMAMGVIVTAPKAASGPAFKDNYGMAEVDQVPVAILKPRPVYPYRARRLNLDGEVDVKFLVDTAGQVSRISILRSSPPKLFEDSVLAALASWRFSPGMVKRRPVNTWVTTTIAFRINEL